MSKVRDAIILAGGIGTRMLPASLFTPKEALPLVDTPVINHLIWEAAKAGADRVHLVLSKRKRKLLHDHIENETIHGNDVRSDLPREALKLGIDGIEIIPHIQTSSSGVADAISVAIDQIEGAFLVLLGDMVMVGEHFSPKQSGVEMASEASLRLVKMFEKTRIPCVGVYPVEWGEVSKYGVVGISENTVTEIVEKPEEENAPSNYVLCGRYLLPSNTSKILGEYPVSEFGELQSIYMLNHLISNGGLMCVKYDEMNMYDSGEPLEWLKSQIDHALRREDIGKALSEWIKSRVE